MHNIILAPPLPIKSQIITLLHECISKYKPLVYYSEMNYSAEWVLPILLILMLILQFKLLIDYFDF